jgi:hypothetical protein
VRCGHTVAFLPDVGVIGSLDPVANSFTCPLPGTAGRVYRLCANYATHNICNWAVRADAAHNLCLACRLTRVIPDLSRPGHLAAWSKIETAKRRLVYTLLRLGLPVQNRTEAPTTGLAFEFLADADDPTAPRVLTGHANGVITLSVAEADEVERERRRLLLHEPHRTLLGHFRHESGHYYWDRLIHDRQHHVGFRQHFGDEQASYADGLQRHYEVGPPTDWPERFVSAYASVHPWEDWAETWTHYLHMVDTLETAADCGLTLQPTRTEAAVQVPTTATFEDMIAAWFPVTFALNNLNRGLGLPDPYPFVLSAPAIDKLRFVHECVYSWNLNAPIRVGADK